MNHVVDSYEGPVSVLVEHILSVNELFDLFLLIFILWLIELSTQGLAVLCRFLVSLWHAVGQNTFVCYLNSSVLTG